MQLVAYGAQDIYLTGNPQITFFKVVYRRHTNFAIESIEQTFNGTPGFGKRVVCTISRNGDLITDAYVEVLVNVDSTANGLTDDSVYYPGEQIMDEITLELGGQQIDKHNSTYYRIFDELYRKDSHKLAYSRLVGEDNYSYDLHLPANGQTRFYIPLISTGIGKRRRLCGSASRRRHRRRQHGPLLGHPLHASTPEGVKTWRAPPGQSAARVHRKGARVQRTNGRGSAHILRAGLRYVLGASRERCVVPSSSTGLLALPCL